MSAVTSTAKLSAASKISDLSCDIEMGCVNLQVLLNSIVKSLDESADDFHASFDAINCFSACAKQVVETVLANSLAIAKAAREVSQ